MVLKAQLAGRSKASLEQSQGTITMGYLQEARKGFLSFLVTADQACAALAGLAHFAAALLSRR